MVRFPTLWSGKVTPDPPAPVPAAVAAAFINPLKPPATLAYPWKVGH